MKVEIEFDEKLLDIVQTKMPWLSYETAEQFISEAVAEKFENLIILLR